jgi:hypothetical protein
MRVGKLLVLFNVMSPAAQSYSLYCWSKQVLGAYCWNQSDKLNKASGMIGGQQTDNMSSNKVFVEVFAKTGKDAVCESKDRYKDSDWCAKFQCMNKEYGHKTWGDSKYNLIEASNRLWQVYERDYENTCSQASERHWWVESSNPEIAFLCLTYGH